MIKVLGRARSINVRKVLWTLDELGLPFEHEAWNPEFKPDQDPQFLALNPNGLAPVLIDDQGVLWESNAICRYLAHRHGDGGPLLPAEPRGRAVVEQWMDWQATELNPTWRYAFLALSRRASGFEDPARIEASVKAWNGRMTLLDQQLQSTGAHVAGAAFSLADIVLGLSVHRWMATPLEHANLPAVSAYYQRLRTRAAFAPYARMDIG